MLFWSDVSHDSGGSPGTESIRVASVPDAGLPTTIAEWPIEMGQPVSKIDAASVAADGSEPRSYVVAGGRTHSGSEGESLLLRVSGLAPPEVLGQLPPVRREDGAAWPCRPIDMVAFDAGAVDAITVLCDGGAKESSAQVGIRVDDDGTVEMSLAPVGKMGGSFPRVACGPDECLVTWGGYTRRAVRLSRREYTRRLGSDRLPFTTYAPTAPVSNGSQFVVMSTHEIHELGSEPTSRVFSPALAEPWEPPAIAQRGDGWIAALASAPTGVALVRGRGTAISDVRHIETEGACRDIRLAASARGYLVAWTERTGSDSDVRAVLLDEAAVAREAMVDVAVGPGRQHTPVVAANDRGYLVAWEVEADDRSIRRVLLDAADGAVVRRASQYPDQAGEAVGLAAWGNGFYFAWRDDGSFRGRRLDDRGRRIEEPTSVDGFSLPPGEEIALASLDDDRMLAVVATGTDIEWSVLRYPQDMLE